MCCGEHREKRLSAPLWTSPDVGERTSQWAAPRWAVCWVPQWRSKGAGFLGDAVFDGTGGMKGTSAGSGQGDYRQRPTGQQRAEGRFLSGWRGCCRWGKRLLWILETVLAWAGDVVSRDRVRQKPAVCTSCCLCVWSCWCQDHRNEDRRYLTKTHFTWGSLRCGCHGVAYFHSPLPTERAQHLSSI